MNALYLLLEQLGAKILWRISAPDRPVGAQHADEIRGAWHPSHKTFIALREQAGPVAVVTHEQCRCAANSLVDQLGEFSYQGRLLQDMDGLTRDEMKEFRLA